jgi:hypothetical protein
MKKFFQRYYIAVVASFLLGSIALSQQIGGGGQAVTAGNVVTACGASSGQILFDNAGSCAGTVPARIRYCATTINFNAGTSDTALSLAPLPTTRYSIDAVRITNASASLSTATIGVFTATGGGGQTIAANQAITVTATATDTVNNTMALTLTNQNTEAYNDATLQIRIGTAQGSAATGDVCITTIPLT